jgi:hypothetical protein
LARSLSLNSDARDNHDNTISDSKSANEVDVDSRWEVRIVLLYNYTSCQWSC